MDASVDKSTYKNYDALRPTAVLFLSGPFTASCFLSTSYVNLIKVFSNRWNLTAKKQKDIEHIQIIETSFQIFEIYQHHQNHKHNQNQIVKI